MKKEYNKPVTEIIVVKDNLLTAQSDEDVSLSVDLEDIEDEGYAE